MADVPRVLVIDKSPDVRGSLADLLGCWGIDVETAPDSAAALAHLVERRYDIAFVDIGMPDLDGIDLVRRLKPACPDTRFILTTAYDGCDRAREARERHGIEVILKPVDPARLLARLVDCIRDRPQTRPAEAPSSASACPSSHRSSQVVVSGLHPSSFRPPHSSLRR